ncbi:hypothetical protein [Desulfosporosinus hippei]|uniref:Uncharacterized protein n=1 Tax=Desulfosporosinus hippei DSM 8344 TaxID=1121419 RepID=A0A1G7TB32_9FIRM|nr:hypothetical protein [Desulfosporosinus hippei]SDG32513.1 hypothetical protein SAMN05443529_102168 [Desulfosporosinus hippei DSM 8344]
MGQLPVKFRVVDMIFHNEGLSNREITKMLKKEYPLDRNVNDKSIDNYLLSLKAVGLIALTNVTSDGHGQLNQCYKITDYGSSRMKYISN